MFGAEMQRKPDEAVDVFLEVIATLLEQSGKMSSVEAQQLLQKQYLTHYGFTSEAALAARPTSLVTFHSGEDPYRGNMREDHLHHFADLKIGELFNISFFEYLQQPRHELKQMREAAEKIAKAKNTAAANSVSAAEKLAKQMGMPQ